MRLPISIAIVLGIIFVILYTYIGMKITLKHHNRKIKHHNVKPMSKLRIYVEAFFLALAGISFASLFIYIGYFR